MEQVPWSKRMARKARRRGHAAAAGAGCRGREPGGEAGRAPWPTPGEDQRHERGAWVKTNKTGLRIPFLGNWNGRRWTLEP